MEFILLINVKNCWPFNILSRINIKKTSMEFILLINVKNCRHFNILSWINIKKLRVSNQEDLYVQVNILVFMIS